MVPSNIRKVVQALVLVAMCVVFYLNKPVQTTTPAGARLASNSFTKTIPAEQSDTATNRAAKPHQ